MCLFQQWPFCYCTFRSLFYCFPYFSSIIFWFDFDCERMNLIEISVIFQPLFGCASTLLFSFKSILLVFNGAWQYFLFPFAIIYTLRGNVRIRSFFGKYRLEKTPYLDIFHAGIRYQSCTLTYKLQDSC